MAIRPRDSAIGSLLSRLRRTLWPPPVERSPEAQRAVDAAAGRLRLYQQAGCPYCARTRRAIRRLRLPIASHDTGADPGRGAELKAGGGRLQVPCLRIDGDDGSCWLYESRDIIRYLERRFPADGPAPDDTA
jgi:glutaredoxin